MNKSKETPRKDVHNSDVPVLCRSCEARHRGICGVLDPNQLVYLAKHTSKHVYEDGDEIIAVGEDVERYANVLGGVVKLSKLLSDGRQQIVGLQFAPDFIGRPFSEQAGVTAEAATSLRVCSFPKSVLEEIIRNTPSLEHKLYQQALSELDEAREWLLTLGRKSAAEKVASFLYMIAANYDPDITQRSDPIRFELPLKRADIADFLGLTIETVSRQMTRLRKAGIISIENNRTIVVPVLRRLRDACETE